MPTDSTRTVVENLRAEELPETLRGGIAPHAKVRVTVEAVAERAGSSSRWSAYAERAALDGPLDGKSEDLLRHVRTFRGEFVLGDED